jgi:hypothetical protein
MASEYGRAFTVDLSSLFYTYGNARADGSMAHKIFLACGSNASKQKEKMSCL